MEVHQILIEADPLSLLRSEQLFIGRYPECSVSMKRYFLSSSEQKEELCAALKNNPESLSCAVSFVIQPVLGEGTIAVWLYLTKDSPVELIWRTNLFSRKSGSEEQTREILETYESDLEAQGLNMVDNCVRTWFYVDDIDENYGGVVVGRRENFSAIGMTKDTHYLASTGIAGKAVEPGTIVQMDALALSGEFSQYYLHAPSNFNPTHEYGVTFERGVVLEYGGESHVLVSGTASIDNKGNIVHPGDVYAQALRMLENVEALLSEASSDWDDVRMIVVYLRNASDYEQVEPIFRRRFKDRIPYVITLAPVCRPGWLIEMECLAVC